jgi:hypothetical protein
MPSKSRTRWTLQQVTDAGEIVQPQGAVKDLVDPLIKQYIVQIVNSTRDHESVPARARAGRSHCSDGAGEGAARGRDFVTPTT